MNKEYKALSNAYFDIQYLLALLPTELSSENCTKPQRDRLVGLDKMLGKMERTLGYAPLAGAVR